MLPIILSGYQPRQMVRRSVNQCFYNHLCSRQEFPENHACSCHRGSIPWWREQTWFRDPFPDDKNRHSSQGTPDENKDGYKNLVYWPFNHLTRLVARESFITVSRDESFRLYTNNNTLLPMLHFKRNGRTFRKKCVYEFWVEKRTIIYKEQLRKRIYKSTY